MTLLASFLNALLPGDGVDWPPAGSHGLGPRVEELAADMPGGAEALRATLAALPEGFSALDQLQRIDVLKAIEADNPAQFALVITATYSAYYTDPAVRDVIATQTGYENRPPQPEGYALEPFDETLLDTVKAREPLWRDASGL